nr:precorrin-3B C(17)-methyltransferase [uncultured Neokomagataea sp.]
MSLVIVGLGPGNDAQRTPEVDAALDGITDVIGYGPYVERLALPETVQRHGSDNRVELDRARHALMLAENGRRVAVVSGGDAGVFGMASAVFEAVEAGPEQWRTLDIRVVPGLSAVLAAAARIGAPLGGDFCVLSLSDNLKPWDVVLRRLRLAAEAGFVMALYNPRSKARPWQLGKALEELSSLLPGDVPVVFARAIGRADERVLITSLVEADADMVDMSTLVLIGSVLTRRIAREGAEDWVYTPRYVPV